MTILKVAESSGCRGTRRTCLGVADDFQGRPRLRFGGRSHKGLQGLAEEVMIPAALYYQHLLQWPHPIPTLTCHHQSSHLSALAFDHLIIEKQLLMHLENF